MTGAPGPLGGITVLDLCSYLAGPYGCTLLADLGASVIKVESPQGDMLRQFPSSLAGESRLFLGTNRGKRAIALDDEPLALNPCGRPGSTPETSMNRGRNQRCVNGLPYHCGFPQVRIVCQQIRGAFRSQFCGRAIVNAVLIAIENRVRLSERVGLLMN